MMVGIIKLLILKKIGKGKGRSSNHIFFSFPWDDYGW